MEIFTRCREPIVEKRNWGLCITTQYHPDRQYCSKVLFQRLWQPYFFIVLSLPVVHYMMPCRIVTNFVICGLWAAVPHLLPLIVFHAVSSTSPPSPSMRWARLVPTSRPLPQPSKSSAHLICHQNVCTQEDTVMLNFAIQSARPGTLFFPSLQNRIVPPQQ